MKNLFQNVEQTRLFAGDINSNPEALAMLEHSSDRPTREALAANPNTPTDVLLRLGTEFPEQLLNNPVFSLLLLENINFIQKIPLLTLRSILKLKNVPEYILEQAAHEADFEVQLALVMNPQTSKAVLQRLTHSPYAGIRAAASIYNAEELTQDNEQKATETIEKILASFHHKNLGILAYICLIPETIVKYWMRNDQDLCRKLANFPATHPNTLRQLANHRDIDIQLAVTKNPSTPLTVLQDLVKNANREIAQAATENIITKQDKSKILIPFDEDTCNNVAERTKRSSESLEVLVWDKDKAVREKAMKNPRLTKNTVERILCGQYALEYLQYNPDFFARNPDSLDLVIDEREIDQPF